MKSVSFALGLACILMAPDRTSAQGDFFFTFAQGDANMDQAMDFDIGDTGSLYIYWSTNGPADSELTVGAFIDVFTDTSGVIEFTAAETFDYAITVDGIPIGNRLLDNVGGGGFVGPAQDVSTDFVDELAAFTITGGPGILEWTSGGSIVFIDTGYDESIDGFNWGRIDFNVIGSGTTNISGAAGDGLIVNGGEVVPAVFTTATIHVASVVPEPTTAGMLFVASIGVINRRRRR